MRESWTSPAWRCRKTAPGETANLLYVSPGTSAAFDFSLTPYRAKLAPGQYRAVFGLHGSREFFSWEFWLEAPA